MRIQTCFIMVSMASLLQSALAAEPNVRVWGTNTYHQLDVPPDLTNAVAVSVGDVHVLALRSDGTVVAWGDNGRGQCNVPAGLANVVSVAAGSEYSVAVQADGTAVFWGTLLLSDPPPPSLLTNVASVATGMSLWTLRKDGTVLFWGFLGGHGIWSFTNVVAVSARYDVYAWASSDGSVRLWVSGGGKFDWASKFNASASVTNAVAVSVGENHILALLVDGTVLGDGYYGPINVPPNLTNVVGISAGFDFSFAVRADGSVAAWGTGTAPGSSLPPDLPFVSQISAGRNASAALVRPGQVVAPPTIVQHPTPATLNAVVGSDAWFRAEAGGFPPLSYQWYHGTMAISGATQSVLHLYNVRADQSGAYKIAATNPGGTTWSEAATLNVLPGLDVHMVPAISVIGTVGLNYRIEYMSPYGSPDSWTPLGTVTLTNSPQFYFDTSAIGQPARLYRSQQVP